MTDDRAADWHSQFAPAASAPAPEAVAAAERVGTVERFAGADGVFCALALVDVQAAGEPETAAE